MDLEEWELLPDEGYLQIHDDGGKKIFSRRYANDSRNEFNMNYFLCPSPKSSKFVENTEISGVPNQLIPLPFHLESRFHESLDDEVVKEVTNAPIRLNTLPSDVSGKIKTPNLGAAEADQDLVSQVFFKKMKENEFVDMKMDSPKSCNRGILPPIDPAGSFQFEDKSEALNSKISSPRVKSDTEIMIKKNNDLDGEENISWEENSSGLNLWSWSLNGIGAICSFGVAAAATIGIIFIGSRQKHKQQNEKLHFQIYTDDKRIKDVVHHATKLNAAVSAIRGVPTRAHITFGGYCDAI